MQLYEQKFEDALSYLSRPDILHPTGDKPICYVNYDVEDAMEVYRMINPTLVPKAKYHGFADVRVVSLGNEIQQYIKNHDYHQPEFWGDNDFNEKELFQSIREEILNNNFLTTRLLSIQEEMCQLPHPLLILKDLELLHPFDKIGRVEQIIYNQIQIPFLVLYPGRTQGINARTFLNIYPMDGSYRSKNF